jgi:hypothetical protein
MREMEGLSYADLAAALDVSIPAVKSLLVRARIGLVEAAEARNTACADIRNDLALSFGKGVRASAVARKHMRECRACSDYRRDLRAVQTGLGALAPPAHPLGLFAKLLGLGAGGGGAAAGGTAAAGGGAAVAGGGVVAGTTAKVAAVVCCAALSAGTVTEIKKHATPFSGGADTAARKAGGSDARVKAAAASAPAAAARPARAETPAVNTAAAKTRAEKASAADRKRQAAAAAPLIPLAEEEAISQHALDEAPPTAAPGAVLDAASAPTGGALAPAEEPQTASTTTQTTQATPPASGQAPAGSTGTGQTPGTTTGATSGQATVTGAAPPAQPASTAPQG